MKIAPAKSQNPFVGLRPFESNEALLFFGRSDQTISLLERLHHHRFLAVVGSSGCGKSSLIRAGLIPKLKAGMLVGDRDRWFVATMKPGDRPWQNLAAALLNAFPEHASLPQEEKTSLAEAMFESDVPAITDTFGQILDDADANLLLLVDQFEEIFRYSKDSKNSNFQEEAAGIISIMLALADQRKVPIYVVLTMRSDFLGECDRFFGLPEAINKSLYLVPRLTRKQRREAIEGPIRLFNQTITPRLLNRLLNDAGDESDQLPVLQHALMRTWSHWQMNGGGPLDIEHYRAIGTLNDALSQDAENALAGMNDEELILAEQIFQALTDTDPGNRQIRRPAHLDEIEAITEANRQKILEIIKRFRTSGRSFLVVSEGEKEEDKLIDISHESLIRQWERLKEWVGKEAEARSMYLRLVESALLHKSGKAGLWRDPELQLGLEWQEETRPNKPWAQRYNQHFDEAISFLAQSKKAKEEAFARKRKRITIRIALSILAVLIIAASLVFYFQQKAEQQTKIAEMGKQIFIEQQEKKVAQEKVEQNRRESDADSMRSLGNKAIVANDYEQALAHFNQALSLYAELGKTHESVLTLIDLGRVKVLANDYDEAEKFYSTALDSSISLGDKNLQGQVLEQFASLSEQKGNFEEAKQYYTAAQASFENSGEQRANGRVLERLAVKEEEAKNYGKAVESYQKALENYKIAGDQFGISRVNTALERIAAIHGSWGYLVDLHTADIYEFKGDEVLIGRSTTDEGIKNDISFSNRLISRLHIFVTRELRVIDMRSRNGTGINGLLLRYGIGARLNDKDIITLADIKALLFSKSQPKVQKIPANAWGILINNNSRQYTYLTASEYGLQIVDENIIPNAGSFPNGQMRLRWKDTKVEMFEVKDEWTVLFQFKETDYDYKTYLMGEDKWYELLPKPLLYVQLSADGSNILKEGPGFQIVSMKEPESQN